MGIFKRGVAYVKNHGIGVTLHKIAQKAGERIFKRYHYWTIRSAPNATELARQCGAKFNNPPFISVVVPVYNTKVFLLDALLDSVLAQTYPHYELVLLDGGSALLETQDALLNAQKRDVRVKVYRAQKNEGISGNTNLAIQKAAGDYIALLDHDDLLTPDALYHVAMAIVEQHADFIYSDEDKVSFDGKFFHTPHFKPDFSPDELRTSNYICHLMVLKKALLDEAGLLDSRFDGSQDHELALRLTEKAQNIIHIPRVLYHWRDVNTSMSRQNLQKCVDAATLAVKEHVDRLGMEAFVSTEQMRAHVRYRMPENTQVTVIVSPQGSRTLPMGIEHMGFDTLLCDARLPRYQALNAAAQKAQGDVLLFIDAGIEVITPLEITTLIGRALLIDAGVVCPTILAPNGTLRHQGYLVGMENIVANPQKGHLMRSWGYFARERMAHNVSAASVAFMVVRRDVFMDAGMFDEGYSHDLGDVDFCLKLLNKGLYHVVLPQCHVTYRQPPKGAAAIVDQAPNAKDAARFHQAHGNISDAFYNPNWSKKNKTYKHYASNNRAIN